MLTSGAVFGQPGTNTAGNTTNTTTGAAPSGGLFGLPPKPADPQGTAATGGTSGTTGTPGSTPAAPSGGLFSGGLFGNKTSAASTTTPATGSSGTAPAASTFNLGGNKDASSTNASTTTGATGGAPSLFNLGGNKPEEKKDEKKDSAPAPPASTFNLFGDKKADGASTAGSAATTADKPKDGAQASTASAPAPSATAGAPTIAVPPPSMLRGKTIEEIVNRWSNELETHVRDFNKFASEVAVWDRALIENGNNLARLYATVLAAEREQNDIDQSLDHIEQQQRDLASTLDAYEKTTEEILGGQGSSLRALDTGPADTERDKNYMLATELHGHLDDLSGSLMQMIDAVNALSVPANGANGQQQDGGEDAIGQIAQILSSHLESLQWIDGAVRELGTKITDVERRVRASTDGGLGSSTKSRGYGLGR
ncbi:hypothetical protein BV20DRAFT_15907 [Pilatotrama ljubarskyi]|nr:hypothetical protein BV20DRAFT_15907 [Pilatotrama ljubarskyi]